MTKTDKHMTEEADIGSGEKNAGDRETEKEIRKIHPEKGGSPDKIKQAEKQKGLVDEDHPFPSKGN